MAFFFFSLLAFHFGFHFGFPCVLISNWDPNISQILLWLIGNRTSCCPIRSLIVLVIKQITLCYSLVWFQTELDSTKSCYHYSSIFLSGLEESAIVGENRNYLRILTSWLSPVVQSSNSFWKRCWRASVDGWAASTFHSRCDGKGPTVTIIRVGRYIFGGYTSVSWGKWASDASRGRTIN